jgi:hypothetical protein
MKKHEQQERCWRVVGPTGSVFQCSIYPGGRHLEVRVSYGDNSGVMQSRLVGDVCTGRKLAHQWLRTVLEVERSEESCYIQ